MGSLTWFRAARRVIGLSPAPEFANLEALLEAEEGQEHEYRVLSWVFPPIIAVGGLAVFIALAVTKSPWFAFGTVGAFVLAGGTWFLLDRMDKSIPRSKQRLCKLANKLWERYRGFVSLVGIEPALAPAVGEVLDEAAGIYIKYANAKEPAQKLFNDSHARAILALEEAMARMLELAEPQSARAQELELSAGWAQPLLHEMRELDSALDHHRQAALAAELAHAGDPLAGLREARQELQRIDNAMDELEQRG